MPRLPVASCWRRCLHRVSLSPASLTTWNGSRTSLACGTTLLTASLYPANASIATTRTFLLNPSDREASHPANTAPLLPSTTSRRRAGRPSERGVRSTTTVTYLEPRGPCAATRARPRRSRLTPSRRCSSSTRRSSPLARTASFGAVPRAAQRHGHAPDAHRVQHHRGDRPPHGRLRQPPPARAYTRQIILPRAAARPALVTTTSGQQVGPRPCPAACGRTGRQRELRTGAGIPHSRHSLAGSTGSQRISHTPPRPPRGT